MYIFSFSYCLLPSMDSVSVSADILLSDFFLIIIYNESWHPERQVKISLIFL